MAGQTFSNTPRAVPSIRTSGLNYQQPAAGTIIKEATPVALGLLGGLTPNHAGSPAAKSKPQSQ